MAKKTPIPVALDTTTNANYTGIHSGDPLNKGTYGLTPNTGVPPIVPPPTGNPIPMPVGVTPEMRPHFGTHGFGTDSREAGFNDLKQSIRQLPQGGVRDYLREIATHDPLNATIPTPEGSNLATYFQQNPGASDWMRQWINQKLQSKNPTRVGAVLPGTRV